MVIMSEWVYGNGKRQRREGLRCVFCQIEPQREHYYQQLEFTPLQVNSLSNANILCGLPIGTIKTIYINIHILNSKLNNANVKRVVSVMNDAGGMSPVCAEVFISSY